MIKDTKGSLTFRFEKDIEKDAKKTPKRTSKDTENDLVNGPYVVRLCSILLYKLRYPPSEGR